MRKVFTILLLFIIGWSIFSVFENVPFGRATKGVGKAYLEKTVDKTKTANVVTAIVVNYRGFDTLGEVTVLFLAATGIGSILLGSKSTSTNSVNSTVSDQAKVEEEKTKTSVIVRTGANLLFPMIILLGIYIFVHGHLTPGGGFQGGAVIASGFLLMFMAFRSYHVSHTLLSVIESFAGLTFVSVGMIGLLKGTTFLQNFLPLGQVNDLFSAGVIPIIYIAVGLKVGAELAGLLSTLLREE